MTNLAIRAVMDGDAKGLVGAARQSEEAINRIRAAAQRYADSRKLSSDDAKPFKDDAAGVGFLEKEFNKLGNTITSVHRLFGPFLAVFSTGALVSFGANIAQNFDEIVDKARDLGIAVDDELVAKMEDAARRSSAAWVRFQTDTAPVWAWFEDRLSDLVEGARAAAAIPEVLGMSFADIAAQQKNAARHTAATNVFGGYGVPYAPGAIPSSVDITDEVARPFPSSVPITPSVEGFNFGELEALRQFEKDRREIIEQANEQETEDAQAFHDQMQGLDDDYEKRLAESQQAALDEGLTNFEGFTLEELNALRQFHKDADEAWAKYYDHQQELSDRINDRVIGDFSQMAASAITGSEDIGEAFERMVRSVAEYIIQLEIAKATQASLGSAGGLSGLVSGIGDFFGLGGGVAVDTSGLSASLSWADVGVFHEGGFAGGGRTTRSVPASVFSGAPRAHTGKLLPGERPIIAKDGEGIFTPQQMDNADSLLNAAMARPAVNVVLNVKTPEGTSARAEQKTSPNGDIQLDVIIDMVDKAIGRRMVRGQSSIGHATEQLYGARRKPTS